MSSALATDPAEEVFEELYARHAGDVYRYALAVLRNPTDAEDITQTTFLNAYRAVKRGERPRLPQHWLIKIAHNACRTSATRASRRPREVPLDLALETLGIPEPERPNLAAVLAALGRLPFNQRSALVMRELEGRSYEEIAETLGVTVAAVETLIFRARRSLRLDREALRTLAGVPLPASLSPFGAAATGGAGAAAGSGVALKVAAVVAALTAGGAALHAVRARDDGQGAQAATPARIAAGATADPLGRRAQWPARSISRHERTTRRRTPHVRSERPTAVAPTPARPKVPGDTESPPVSHPATPAAPAPAARAPSWTAPSSTAPSPKAPPAPQAPAASTVQDVGGVVTDVVSSAQQVVSTTAQGVGDVVQGVGDVVQVVADAAPTPTLPAAQPLPVDPPPTSAVPSVPTPPAPTIPDPAKLPGVLP